MGTVIQGHGGIGSSVSGEALVALDTSRLAMTLTGLKVSFRVPPTNSMVRATWARFWF